MRRRLLAAENQEGLQEALQEDYITFQKYNDYYPAIEQLESTQSKSLISHWATLSALSRLIMRWFAGLLAVLAVVFGIQLKFAELCVVLGVFVQLGLVLYFVHWQWHRFDLSLDAVIKFCASGFVLGISMTLAVETVLGQIGKMLVTFVLALDAEQEGIPPQLLRDHPELVREIIKQNLGVWAVFLFFACFVIYALTEELCKYFSYWMVETPDQQIASRVDKRRQAAQITVGMVAAAAGFACMENLQYILPQPGVRQKLFVLVARTLTPLHPILAAIQSIGVVRRDVEGDARFQLGRSILPAVLVHGTFDFALFFGSLYAKTHGVNDDASDDDDDDYSNNDALLTEAAFVVVAVVVMLTALVYYCCAAQRQRRRLDAAEADAHRTSWSDKR